MRRSKKLIVIAVLATVVLAGGIGGVVFAQTENGDDSQPEAQLDGALQRVCEIYEEKTGVAIDQEVLKDAFAQARSEMREAALDSYLQKLVGEGKITQDEADQYLEWWQARPDVPVRFGFRGHGGFHGISGMPRFCPPCAPAE